MIAGKVVGSVISTRKCENLVGNKFMIVDVLDHMQHLENNSLRLTRSEQE